MTVGATLLTLVMFERLIASFLDLPLEDKSLKVGTFNE
jgi:hypothetical protein